MALTLPRSPDRQDRLSLARMIAIGVFAFLCAATVLAFYPVFHSMIRTWFLTTAFNHGFLVPIASAAFIWLRRRELADVPIASAWLTLLAFAGLVPVYLLAAAAGIMVAQQLIVVTMLICAFVATFGWQMARACAFPLAFLYLMVPLGDQLIFPMQQLTASASVFLLRLADVPVFHDGTMLVIPSGIYEVGEACAGLRFLIANVVVAVIFAFVVYKKEWKRVAFIAFAPAVAMVANVIRAFGLVYIGHLTESTHSLLDDHYFYGWVVFALTLLFSFWIGDKFADRDDPDAPVAGSGPAPIDRWRPAVAVTALAVILAAPVYAAAVMQPPGEPAVAFDTSTPPAGWTEVEAPGNWRPAFVAADASIYRSFAKGRDAVDLFVPFYGFQRGEAELIRSDNRYHDNDLWLRLETKRVELPVTGVPSEVTAQRLAANGADPRIVFTWYWLDGTWTTSAKDVFTWTARERVLGHFRPVATVALSVPQSDNFEEAALIAADFIGDGDVLNRLMAGFEVER